MTTDGRGRVRLARMSFAVGLLQVGFDDVKITLRGGQVFVAQQLLDVAQVGPGLEHFTCERVAERVRRKLLLDLRPALVGAEFVKQSALFHLPPEAA